MRMKTQQQTEAKRNAYFGGTNGNQTSSSSSGMMMKVTLCWSVLGESSSGIHLRRCRSSSDYDMTTKMLMMDEDQENVRVLRESWYTMDVPVSL